MKPNGYVLHATATRVAIATGFSRPSANAKTGPMIQVWILPARADPVISARSGADSSVCGSCPLRSAGCYVNLGQAPLGVWHAWRRGAYPSLSLADVPDAFRGRSVRLGAYGDPAFLPLALGRAIVDSARSHTGYTHRWRSPLVQGWRSILMASTETSEQSEQARALGWRVFSTQQDSETILCPSKQGVSCVDCGLCSGSTGPDDARADIYIPPHGKQANRIKELQN